MADAAKGWTHKSNRKVSGQERRAKPPGFHRGVSVEEPVSNWPRTPRKGGAVNKGKPDRGRVDRGSHRTWRTSTCKGGRRNGSLLSRPLRDLGMAKKLTPRTDWKVGKSMTRSRVSFLGARKTEEQMRALTGTGQKKDPMRREEGRGFCRSAGPNSPVGRKRRFGNEPDEGPSGQYKERVLPEFWYGEEMLNLEGKDRTRVVSRAKKRPPSKKKMPGRRFFEGRPPFREKKRGG